MKRWWILLMCLSLPVWADNAIRGGHCEVDHHLWTLSLNSNLSVPNEPADALRSGIPLTFHLIIELRTPGFISDDVTRITHPYILRYNHITQTYLLQDAVNHIETNFPTLNAAITALGNVQNLPVISTGLLNANKRYTLRAKIELATEELPVSLRLSAFFSKDWAIETPWWTCPANGSDA